jgi:hypothetical protein
MPFTVFGLPSHILLIHATVVAIPTSCLATIAVAARPGWRRRFGVLAAIYAVLVVPLTYATQLAGEQLFNHATYLDAAAAEHRRLGETLVWFVLAMAALTVLLVIADRVGYADNHSIMVGLAGLTIAASAVCIVRVVQVGDSGARAVWSGVVQTSNNSKG